MSLFIGKGGVGKTTVSAAYAVHSALKDPKKNVLLLSTDPAHSLADVLQQPLAGRPARVRLPGPGRLSAWQINAEKQFRAFLDDRKTEILSILESGSIFSREEIAPFLDANLPGMAEMAALLAIHDALGSGRYSQVVVDTAPFGHTLRLFEMPEHFERFLSFLELAASRDRVLAAHFGGSAKLVGAELLSDWRATIDALRQAFLRDARLFLVTTPETFALNESFRCAAVLRGLSPPLEISTIVLNRAVSHARNCRICLKLERATKSAYPLLKKKFPKAQMHTAEDTGAPIVGTEGLKAFADHVFIRNRLNWKPSAPKTEKIDFLPAKWPVLDTPLTLVLGKGGVGKTTISAALGFQTRVKSHLSIEICSVDPAPSLDDIFQTEVGDQSKPVLGDPKFHASEMDPAAGFKEWAERVKRQIDDSMTSDGSQVHIDLWFERQLFEQLLESVPPGLDEILAVFRMVDLLAEPSRRIVVDMAPTGHALELLRTPERILVWTRLLLKTLAAHRKLAIARDAGVEVAQLGQRVRSLAEILKNPERTTICTVMLAESLPDRETERLVADLRSLDLSPGPLFVNRVLFRKDVGKCGRCRRASDWQMATLSKLRRRYKETSIFVARNFPSEIAGKRGLRSFTSELWQLA